MRMIQRQSDLSDIRLAASAISQGVHAILHEAAMCTFTVDKGAKMKPRSIFAAAFLLVLMLHAAVARPVQKVVNFEPPPLGKILANTTGKPHGVLAEVIAIKPEIPLGPLDVLKAYEHDMTLVAQKMSADVASISQAQEANQITREQAEYLIQERYEVAMMQFQTLSALHDALGHDVAQATARQDASVPSRTQPLLYNCPAQSHLEHLNRDYVILWPAVSHEAPRRRTTPTAFLLDARAFRTL
jgi:hypothetical protein